MAPTSETDALCSKERRMLSDFVLENRTEIVARCRAKVAARMVPRPTDFELEHGVPLFLDELAHALRSTEVIGRDTAAGIAASATHHGSDLLRSGFTIAQVVYDYSDICQTITEMAIEQHAPIPNPDFQKLNLCLDVAIAKAVTEYARQRELKVAVESTERESARAIEELGFLAHELRNLLGTAALSFEAIRSGSVGISGSTGAVLGRSLISLGSLVDRSLAAVRLTVGINARERIVVHKFIEEIEVSAMMEAKAHGHRLTVEANDAGVEVEADRQILASIVANLVQNACKHTHANSHVFLRSLTTIDGIRFEIEDECGGLPPGKVETLFKAFTQASHNRSGLGLGLAICDRGIRKIGGTIRVQDRPGKGCVFIVELPNAPQIS
jgi:signal transduction histidine kinase